MGRNRTIYVSMVAFLGLTAVIASAPLDEGVLELIVGGFVIGCVVAVAGMAVMGLRGIR